MGVSVRYARFYPITGLVLGGLSLFFNVLLLLVTDGGATAFCALIPAALFFYFGLTGWNKTYFTYHRKKLTVGAMFGPITREVPGRAGGKVVVRDGRIRLLKRDGTERGAVVARWAAYGPDWDKALAAIERDNAG